MWMRACEERLRISISSEMQYKLKQMSTIKLWLTHTVTQLQCLAQEKLQMFEMSGTWKLSLSFKVLSIIYKTPASSSCVLKQQFT